MNANVIPHPPAIEQIELHYQPIIELSTGACFALEGLCRWPTGGYTSSSPAWQFAHHPAAEVREEFLKKTVILVAEYLRRRNAAHSIPISVNINLADITPALCRWMLHVVGYYRIPPQQLILEASESSPCTAQAVSCVHWLRDKGFPIIMDDYGIAYSNDERLRAIPFDGVKIDKQILPRLRDQEVSATLKHTIHKWQNKGMGVTLEGVETLEHLRIAHALNVNYVQGYLVSRAIPPQDTQDWLNRWDMQSASTAPSPA